MSLPEFMEALCGVERPRQKPIHSLSTVRTKDRREAALRYAELGLPTFPIHGVREGKCTCERGAACPFPGKHRLWSGSPLDATTNADTIEGWWSRWPGANLAAPTGETFWALDVDAQPAGAVLASLIETGRVPRPACVARSGSGGLHAYFAHEQLFPPMGSGEALVPGVDVLCGSVAGRPRGAWVILPPSRGIKGAYEWIDS